MASRPPVPPITNQFPIVDGGGRPSDYFIRWLQERGFEIDGAITEEQVNQLIEDWSATRSILAGVGLSGGGTLNADVTLDLDAVLNDLNDVDTTSTPPVDTDVLTFDGGLNMWVPKAPTGGGGGGAGGLVMVATQTLTVAAATMDFPGIPATYKDLVVALNVRGTNATTNVDLLTRANGDTGANYSHERVHWFDTGSGVSQGTAQTSGVTASIAAGSATANHASAVEIVIPNYANTTFFKQAITNFFSSLGTAAFTQGRGIYGFQWLNTAAINRLTFAPAAGNFAAGSTITLYARTGATAGGPTLPVVRGSNIQSSSTASYTVSWPAGTVAGDRAVIFAGHGFGINVPSGWAQLSNLTGANWNGAAFTRVLSAADITAGSVTVTTAGAFNGVVACVTFVGAAQGVRLPIVESRNTGGAASRTLATDGSPLTTDFILYFGSNRNSSVNTVSLGTGLQTITATSASGVLTGAPPAAIGGVSANFNYGTFGGTTGDYQIIVVVSGG